MEPDVAAGLVDLEQRLQRLKELLEWQRLFDQEGPRFAGEFWRRNANADDLAVAHGSFISLAFDLQAILDGLTTQATLADLCGWQQQLQIMVQECHDLAIPETFINR